ncbi:MAG: YqjF family protein, partial [Terriglobia bacterium]
MKRLLEEVAHRPWPLPRRPRVMAQRWHEVLFAHWQVPVEALRRLVPAPLELDTVGEQAWIGVIPFRMSGVRLRWAPALPGLSAFPELNVRTYVVFGGKPGVFFFSLDAANRLAVEVARRWYRLPYFHARMTIERRGEWFEYESRRVGAEADFIGRYRPLDRRVAESAEDSQRRIHHRDTLRLRSGQA